MPRPYLAKFEVVEQEGMRFVKIGLADETVRPEAGALSSMGGHIVMDVPLPSVGKILKSYLSEPSYPRGPTMGPGGSGRAGAPYWQFRLLGPQPSPSSTGRTARF